MERFRQHDMDHGHLAYRIERRCEREVRDSNLLTGLGGIPSNSDGAICRELDGSLHGACNTAKPKVEGDKILVRRNHGKGGGPSK